jgi:hypothetical protein
MGQNADDLFFELGYIPFHALKVTAFSEVFRKGGTLPIADQYANDQGDWTFLFGPLHVERSVGMTAKYQPIRDIFVHFDGRLHTIQDEADPSQNRTHQFECTIGASLGLW